NGELLILDFPARPATTCPAPPELINGLGTSPNFTAKARDYLAVFDSEQTVRDLKPNFELLERLDAVGIIVTAPGEGSDFVSRFSAPRRGTPEAPATGAALCTLILYWAERWRRDALHASQVPARGGELFCKNRRERVCMAGRAITYLSGFI